jgi:hypothetical protein
VVCTDEHGISLASERAAEPSTGTGIVGDELLGLAPLSFFKDERVYGTSIFGDLVVTPCSDERPVSTECDRTPEAIVLVRIGGSEFLNLAPTIPLQLEDVHGAGVGRCPVVEPCADERPGTIECDRPAEAVFWVGIFGSEFLGLDPSTVIQLEDVGRASIVCSFVVTPRSDERPRTIECDTPPEVVIGSAVIGSEFLGLDPSTVIQLEDVGRASILSSTVVSPSSDKCSSFIKGDHVTESVAGRTVIGDKFLGLDPAIVMFKYVHCTRIDPVLVVGVCPDECSVTLNRG